MNDLGCFVLLMFFVTFIALSFGGKMKAPGNIGTGSGG